MKVTAITVQARDKDRVNVSIDGKYRFSLDIVQVGELGVKIGTEYTGEELKLLEAESQFGKVYVRALEYALIRPRSLKEIKDYLYRKTRSVRTKNGDLKDGVSPVVTKRVLQRLVECGYIDDEKFARFWVENRNVKKGASKRKLQAELRAKGVDSAVIEQVLGESPRDDADELQKIIAKKRGRYSDDQKLMQYLARQGFDYDLIREVIQQDSAAEL